MVKGKNFEPRILYPTKLLFLTEGKMKTFFKHTNLILAAYLYYKKMLKVKVFYRRNMTPDRNLNLQKEMKSIKNGIHR